jgi:hypothetical protein
LDLYDTPRLHFGFYDRMHLDQYGFYQLASHMLKDETYLRFLEAVDAFYSTPPASAQTVAPPYSVSRERSAGIRKQ